MCLHVHVHVILDTIPVLVSVLLCMYRLLVVFCNVQKILGISWCMSFSFVFSDCMSRVKISVLACVWESGKVGWGGGCKKREREKDRERVSTSEQTSYHNLCIYVHVRTLCASPPSKPSIPTTKPYNRQVWERDSHIHVHVSDIPSYYCDPPSPPSAVPLGLIVRREGGRGRGRERERGIRHVSYHDIMTPHPSPSSPAIPQASVASLWERSGFWTATQRERDYRLKSES